MCVSDVCVFVCESASGVTVCLSGVFVCVCVRVCTLITQSVSCNI